MNDIDIFENIALTSSHDEMGEKLYSDKQRRLFDALSDAGRILYCAGWGGVTSTDLYGPIKIQSIGNEDRLFFPKNNAHVHVKWSQVCEAKPVTMPDHPGGKDCFWIGIDFLTQEQASLFSVWNLQADQPFSDEVRAQLGLLV